MWPGAFRQLCWRLVPSPVWWPWLISLSYHIYWEMGDANKTKSGWVHLGEPKSWLLIDAYGSQKASWPLCSPALVLVGPQIWVIPEFPERSWAVSGIVGRIRMILLVFNYIIGCPGALFEIQTSLMWHLEAPRVTGKSSWCFALGLSWAQTLPNMENWNV